MCERIYTVPYCCYSHGVRVTRGFHGSIHTPSQPLYYYIIIQQSAMAGKGPTGMKVQRMKKMLKMVQGAGDVGLIRFIATCEFQMGLTEATIRSYLTTLEKVGFIKVDEATDTVREVAQE